MGAPGLTALDRFFAKVEVEAKPRKPGLTPCWRWTGALSRGGQYAGDGRSKGGKPNQGLPYANFYFEGRAVRAFRWIYEKFVGPIPEGEELHHRCEFSECVNYHHGKPEPGWRNAAMANRNRKRKRAA